MSPNFRAVEAAKLLRRPPGSVRSMLHVWASVGELAGSGSPSTPCRGRCTPVPRRFRNGSIVDAKIPLSSVRWHASENHICG
jgi:hypothetical protein